MTETSAHSHRWSAIVSPADLGLAVQAARGDRGWSQRDLAARTHIAQSAISDIESGKYTLFLERLFTLLNECGVELRAEWHADDDARS